MAQVETMAKTRNLQEIRWIFSRGDNATNLSKAIQRRLCTDKLTKTSRNNVASLHVALLFLLRALGSKTSLLSFFNAIFIFCIFFTDFSSLAISQITVSKSWEFKPVG